MLRDVEEPELIDSLIQATKDGDHGMLQRLFGSIKFDDDDAESEYVKEEEVFYDMSFYTVLFILIPEVLWILHQRR